MELKFKAKAKLDNQLLDHLGMLHGQILDCTGTIKIIRKRKPQAYVGWQIYFCSHRLAGRSENYFFEDETGDDSEILSRALKKIERYRIGRKKVFFDVEFAD